MAKYYDYDFDYLIEKEAGVRHCEVFSQDLTRPITQRVALHQWMLKNRSAGRKGIQAVGRRSLFQATLSTPGWLKIAGPNCLTP